MTVGLDAAARACAALDLLRERALVDHLVWLPSQDALFHCPARFAVFRAGNQAIGKTYAGLRKAIAHLRGEHPSYEVPAPPVVGMLVCSSWQQSLLIQQKLWDLLPKDELTDRTIARYSVERGWGEDPIITHRNGSRLYVRTIRQGALNLAGGTLHFAMIDELCPARIASEVRKRVLRTGGWVWVCATMVNGDPDWLIEETRRGVCVDIHTRLVPEALIPAGWPVPARIQDGTICDEAWIRRVIEDTLPHEVDVLVHGEWEARAIGQLFAAFRRDGPGPVLGRPSGDWSPQHAHVVDAAILADLEVEEARLGIDYGTEGRQHAVLSGVVRHEDYPLVAILGEWAPETLTDEEQDADGLLALLRAHGLRWDQLTRAYGDRAMHTGHAGEKVASKSNAGLSRAIARSLGLRKDAPLSPRISTVKRGRGHGAGSVQHGEVYLHRLMVRPGRYLISTAAPVTIEAHLRYDGRAASPAKHPIDAIRYSIDDLIFGRRPGGHVRIQVG